MKHGRVAMLAVTGYLVQESFKFPGELAPGLAFADIPNGVAAIGVIPSFGWLQIVGSIGFWELIGWEDKKPVDSEFGVGDLCFYPASAIPKTEKAKAELLTKELQNGRLAMLAIIELITHDIAKPAGEGLFVVHHF